MEMEDPDLYTRISDIIIDQLNEKIFKKYHSNIKWLQSGDEIIDIGCGPGKFTVKILDEYYPSTIKKVYATDVSRNMINFASKTYSNNPKITFDILDIGKDLPDNLLGHFDHLVSSFCIHRVKDQKKVLKNFYDLLKPGGDTLFWMVSSHPQVCTYYSEMAQDPKWKKYIWDPEDYVPPYQNEKFPETILKKNLEESGFKVEICDNLSMEVQWPDKKLFKDFVESVNPYVKDVSKEDKKEYVDVCFEKVKNYPRKNEDDVNVYYIDVLVAYAYKQPQ